MDNSKKLVVWNDPRHLAKILKWKGIDCTLVSKLLKVDGYHGHNKIIDINRVFSREPAWHPVDRTGLTNTLFNYEIKRPWQVPTEQWTIEEALARRVKNLESRGQRLNLFWSGGIDSTTALVALLQNLSSLSQLRVLYSPHSTYEHPGYLEFLQQFENLELVDISGLVYMDTQFDGIFVTGEGGDELNASLDQSFFEHVGYEQLHRPWKDYFAKHDVDIDFCDEYFAQSGRPIETLLEARWWFYTSCKNDSIINSKLSSFFDYKDFTRDRIEGFFNCAEFENYIYWNIDQVLIGQEYRNWKQNLKNYVYEFDGFDDWHKNKSKYGSNQVTTYFLKKIALQNTYWLGILNDGTRLTTPSLPILTEAEFKKNYPTYLDYLFNEPDKI